MILSGIVALLAAGIAQLAQQAGQSIQQWIQSPQGQQQIQNLVSQYGPGVLKEIAKKLGIDL